MAYEIPQMASYIAEVYRVMTYAPKFNHYLWGDGLRELGITRRQDAKGVTEVLVPKRTNEYLKAQTEFTFLQWDEDLVLAVSNADLSLPGAIKDGYVVHIVPRDDSFEQEFEDWVKENITSPVWREMVTSEEWRIIFSQSSDAMHCKFRFAEHVLEWSSSGESQ